MLVGSTSIRKHHLVVITSVKVHSIKLSGAFVRHVIECRVNLDVVQVDGASLWNNSLGAEHCLLASGKFGVRLESFADTHDHLEVEVVEVRHNLEPDLPWELDGAGHDGIWKTIEVSAKMRKMIRCLSGG